jgi:hypothetical protein
MEDNSYIKITKAVYKILDFLPDGDPLKNRAKEKALAILENVTLISGTEGWVSLQKEKASAIILDDIEILKNYLKIGKNQGWIDNINFLIIIKEYDNIKSGINMPKGLMRQSLEVVYKTIKEESTLAEDADKEEINPVRSQASEASADVRGHQTSNGVKKAKTIQPLIDVLDNKQQSYSNNNQLINKKKYSERQGKILEILEKKEKAQVSDFMKELPNITKRTVRRDLDDLLKRGKVIRAGEWNQVSYKIGHN